MEHSGLREPAVHCSTHEYVGISPYIGIKGFTWTFFPLGVIRLLDSIKDIGNVMKLLLTHLWYYHPWTQLISASRNRALWSSVHVQCFAVLQHQQTNGYRSRPVLISAWHVCFRRGLHYGGGSLSLVGYTDVSALLTYLHRKTLMNSLVPQTFNANQPYRIGTLVRASLWWYSYASPTTGVVTNW